MGGVSGVAGEGAAQGQSLGAPRPTGLAVRRPGDLLDALVEAAGDQDVDQKAGGNLRVEIVPGQSGMPGLHRQVEIAWRVGRAHIWMAPAGRSGRVVMLLGS